MKSNSKRMAMTLVELLVVVSIIGVLTGIALPAVQQARGAARLTTCKNQLKQVALATLNYESAHRALPTGVNSIDSDAFQAMSWLASIVPFLEEVSIWDQIQLDYSENSSPFEGHMALSHPVATFACPSEPDSNQEKQTHQGLTVATTSYVGVSGLDYSSRDGVLIVDHAVRLSDVSDGASNTLLAGERPPSPDSWYGWWYAGYASVEHGSSDMILGMTELNRPLDIGFSTYLEHCPSGPYRFVQGKGEQCDALHFWSHHPSGAGFALADGSVHFLPYETDDSVMSSLATRNGGEVVNAF